MAFGEAIPPFSFPDSNTGIELEIIGEALAYHDHVLKPKYFPLARVPFAFKLKDVDAAMTDLGEDMKLIGAYYGNSAVIYDNVFITLKERDLKIAKPEDLTGLSVLSFQSAIKRYPEWLKPVDRARLYFEQNDQLLQVMTLNRGHFDVVLSDISIFKYYTLQLQREEGKKPKPVQFHHFVNLNPLDYRPIFWDEEIRDDFNEGLAYLKAIGRYQAIYDQYLEAQ